KQILSFSNDGTNGQLRARGGGSPSVDVRSKLAHDNPSCLWAACEPCGARLSRVVMRPRQVATSVPARFARLGASGHHPSFGCIAHHIPSSRERFARHVAPTQSQCPRLPPSLDLLRIRESSEYRMPLCPRGRIPAPE